MALANIKGGPPAHSHSLTNPPTFLLPSLPLRPLLLSTTTAHNNNTMPLITLRDGRALDETSDWIDDGEPISALELSIPRYTTFHATFHATPHAILHFLPTLPAPTLEVVRKLTRCVPPTVNVLKPRVNALMASPARSNRSLGSDFTPDLTPISSSTPSEVDPTELRDEYHSESCDSSDNGHHYGHFSHNAHNGHDEYSDEAELNGSNVHPLVPPSPHTPTAHTHDTHEHGNSPSHAEEADKTDRPEQQQQPEQGEKVFRDYANACDRVKNFYAEQHMKQTMEYNLRARHHFHTREKMRMSVWQAVEKLNELVDDSDPDVSRACTLDSDSFSLSLSISLHFFTFPSRGYLITASLYHRIISLIFWAN